MPVLVFVHGGGFFGGSANSVDGSLLVSTATEMVSHQMRMSTAEYRVNLSSMLLSSTESEYWGSRRFSSAKDNQDADCQSAR